MQKSHFKMEIRRWTKTTIQCYERGCVCEGCFFEHFFSSVNQRCHVKEYVIESVRRLGKPESAKEKTIILEEV